MAKTKAKGPGGRPTRYNNEFHPILVEAFARLKHTDEEMADRLGISVATFYNWRNKNIEFLEAINRGKIPTDDQVQSAFLKRALGFYVNEEKVFHYRGKIIRTTIRRYYPPDVAACFIWLKNRRSDQWKDRPESNDTDEALKTIQGIFETITGKNQID